MFQSELCNCKCIQPYFFRALSNQNQVKEKFLLANKILHYLLEIPPWYYVRVGGEINARDIDSYYWGNNMSRRTARHIL